MFLVALLIAGLLGAGFLASTPLYTAQAAPERQIPIYTPTPLPDGRILYIVQPNDSLLSISLLTGVTVEKLRALNNLNNDTIIVGQTLLLGLAGPPEVTFTPGPTPTPTPLLPTPSPRPGSGNLCVLLFNDLNGDTLRQESEPSIPSGFININSRSGAVSITSETEAGTEATCFESLDEGEYNISVAVPAGYNPTTVTSFILNLGAGESATLDFGAQINSETLNEAPTPEGSGKSPILAIVGGMFLLSGLVLAVFAGRLLKGK